MEERVRCILGAAGEENWFGKKYQISPLGREKSIDPFFLNQPNLHRFIIIIMTMIAFPFLIFLSLFLTGKMTNWR